MNNFIKQIFDQNKDKTNFAYIDGNGALSYSELKSASLGFANFLLEQGIKPRDYVIIAVPASRYWPAIFYGCVSVGIIPVPIEDDTPTDAIKKIVNKLTPRAIVSNQQNAELSDLLLVNSNIVGTINKLDAPYYDYDDQDLAFVLTTSGTTGNSKPVAHRHKIFKDITQFVTESRLGIDEHSVIMCTSRPNFAWAVSNNLIVSPSTGATCVTYDQKVDPSHIANYINTNKVTHVFSFPLAYNLLNKKSNVSFGDHLKVCISATEPLPLPIAQKFKEKFNRPLFSNLGWSEMPWFGVGNSIDFNKENTIGKPLSSLKTKVLTAEGIECDKNQPGLLWIGSDNISTGYLTDRHTVDRSEFDSGWWCTNDIVFIDDDGFYNFITRNNRYVKINSYWVSAPEIESLIMSTNLVDDCTVAFDTNNDGYPQVIAYVIPSSSTTTSDSIRTQLLKTAKSHLVPKRFYFVPDLPRTARNKKVILKDILDKHYESFGLETT